MVESPSLIDVKEIYVGMTRVIEMSKTRTMTCISRESLWNIDPWSKEMDDFYSVKWNMYFVAYSKTMIDELSWFTWADISETTDRELARYRKLKGSAIKEWFENEKG